MNIKKITFISIISAFFSAVLRYLDMTINFDGLMLEKNFHLSTMAIVICFIPGIFWAVNMYNHRRTGQIIQNDKNMVLGYTSIFCSILSLYTAYNFWLDYKFNKSLNDPTQSVVGFSVSGPFAVVCFIMAAYLIISGLLHFFKGESVFEKVRVLELLPVIYGLVLVTYVYVHFSTSLLISENIFTIVTSCSLVLAFLYKGKFLSQTDDNLKAYNRTVLFALLAFCMSCSYFYSNALILITTGEYVTDFPVLLQFMNLIYSGYIIIFLLSIKISVCKIIRSKMEKTEE